MATTTTNVLTTRFTTSDGTMSLNISYYDTEAASSVSSFMDTVIANGAIFAKTPLAKKEAFYTVKTKTDLTI